MLSFILVLFYVIPIQTVSDPAFSHPPYMQSGFHDVVTATTSTQSGTITLGPLNAYTSPRAIVALSSIEFTANANLDFYVKLNSINPASLTVGWYIGSTTDQMRFSFLIWEYQNLKYPFSILNRNGLNGYKFTYTSATYSDYTDTGSQRSVTHSFSLNYFDQLTIKVMITGIYASSLSNQYNINATSQGCNGYFVLFTIQIGANTQLNSIYISVLTWAPYFFIQDIYSVQSSIAFIEDKREGLIPNNDNAEFLTIFGWSGISVEVSSTFKFDFSSIQATDFFPDQLTNLVAYNRFEIIEFSAISCSSAQLDTLTFKCKTTTEMYGCSTYEHIIKMPLEANLERLQISPEGKYLIGCKQEKVYVLQYNMISAKYSIFQEINLAGTCLNLQTNRNWSYLAVVIQERIQIYGFNTTYKPLLQIKEGNYTQSLSFSANATFIFAKISNPKAYVMYRLNYSTATYEKFYYLQTFQSTQYFHQIKEGGVLYIRLENSQKNLILNNLNNIYQVNDTGEYIFAGMDITSDETIQVTFNADYLVVYNIDEKGKRTIHQIMSNQLFKSRYRNRAEIQISEDGLTLVFMSRMENDHRRIMVYERDNITADFIQTKHIKIPNDLDSSQQQLQVSQDGKIIITSYKQTDIILYYCMMTINDSEILPDITFNISQPFLEQAKQQVEIIEDDRGQSNYTQSSDETKEEIDGLTIFIAIICIVNFLMLIIIAIFILKKFAGRPTQQPNHGVIDSYATYQTKDNARLSDNTQKLADFSQEELKVPEEPPKVNWPRRKRKKQQLQINQIESLGKIDQGQGISEIAVQR